MFIKRIKNSSKGQSSVEFIITLSLVLVIFLSFLAIFEKRNNEFKETDKRNIASSVVHELAFNINQISVSPENTNKTLFLKNISDDVGNYNILILPESKLIQINYNDRIYSYPINTDSIEKKNITSSNIVLLKKEGFIYVNE